MFQDHSRSQLASRSSMPARGWKTRRVGAQSAGGSISLVGSRVDAQGIRRAAAAVVVMVAAMSASEALGR